MVFPTPADLLANAKKAIATAFPSLPQPQPTAPASIPGPVVVPAAAKSTPAIPSPAEIYQKATGKAPASVVGAPAKLPPVESSGLPGATIAAAPQTLLQKAKNAVAPYVPDFIKAGLETVSEGLFGKTGITPTTPLPGVEAPTRTTYDTGLFGFLNPFPSQTERIERRVDALVGIGTQEDKAYQIAMDEVTPKKIGETSKIVLDSKQQTVLGILSIGELANMLGGVSDIGNTASKILQKVAPAVISRLATEGVETGARKILATELKLPSEVIDALAPKVTAAKTPAEVAQVFNDYVRAVSETKTAAIPKPEELLSRVEPIVPTKPVIPAGPPGSPATAEEAAQRYWDEVIAPKSQKGEATIIGADDMKDYFGKDYETARHPVYSRGSFLTYERALKENTGDTVRIIGAGTGSGKTEMVTRELAPNFNGIIYDSTLTNYEGAVKQIDMARKAGKNVEIYGIIPDLRVARYFTLAREAKTGRGVSITTFSRTHNRSIDNLLRLAEDGEHVTIHDTRGITTPEQIRDRSLTRTLTGTKAIDELQKVRYTEEEIQRHVQSIKFENNARGVGPLTGGPEGDVPAPRGIGANPAGESVAAGEGGRILRSEEPGATAGSRVVAPPASKGTEISPGKTPTPELLKTLSEEKMPGPIADRLRTEYPFLSRHTSEMFASRLANMKRTPDIEAMLKMLSSTDEALKQTAVHTPGAIKVTEASASRAGLDRVVADILTPQEIDRQIDLVSRAIQTPDRAVLAQHEYDLLWEKASQPVLDRMGQVEMERSFLNDILESDPAGELYREFYRRLGRDVGDPTMALEDVMNKAQAKVRAIRAGQRGLTLARYEEAAQRLDTHIEALGFKDFDEAQTAIEKYKKVLDRAEELTEELRDLRPRARAIRLLQPMMEDVPVIARQDVGAIDALADPSVIRGKYKDITGFTGQARDVYRNFEHVFGDSFPEVKRAILDPFDAAKGAHVDEINGLGDLLESGIAKKFGFVRGSKEDQAIMDWGEREIAKTRVVPGINFEYTTEDGLVKAFGREKAGKIMEAERWFHEQYDRLIDEANAVRAKVYPNNPSKLIPKRSDYFRHYQELGGDFRKLVDLFENPAGIDPQLAGISEFTKPMSKYLSFAQRRVGEWSERSAMGGFIDYAPAFSYMKHIDPEIGKFRYLRRKLAESSPTPGVTEIVEENGKRFAKPQKGINDFLEYLDDYANDLAGKTNPVDRYLQKVVPGGRKTFRAISWTNSRVKSNQILGNLSSSIAQAYNLPQGISEAGLYTVPGIKKTISSVFVHNEAMDASAFIKERYMQDLAARFKVSWADHPITAGTDRAKEIGVWITQVLDEGSTKLMWNSFYSKALGEMGKVDRALAKDAAGIWTRELLIDGVPYTDPVKYADDLTRKMVAGRGIGEVPLIQKSKIFQLVAPFQVEVGNAWWVMKDWVSKKDFGRLVTFFVMSYLMNSAAERIRGSRVIFDPINATIEGATDAINEMQDGGTPMRAATIFAGRELGEVLSNVPLGQTFAAAIPDTWLQGIGFAGGKQEVFGNGNPGRFGSGLLVLNAASDPFFKLLPPLGGAQVEKTYKGIKAMLSGSVDSATGKLNFTIDPNPISVTQAVLFGQNATPEARDFYSKRDDLFRRVYRQDALRSDLTLAAETEWKKAQDMAKLQGTSAAVKYLQDLTKNDPQLGNAVAGIAKSDAQGLNGIDRLVSMLNVSNGERAKYIVDQIRGMGSLKERAAFLNDLQSKKLITKQVAAQIAVMLNLKPL